MTCRRFKKYEHFESGIKIESGVKKKCLKSNTSIQLQKSAWCFVISRYAS